MKMFTMKEAGRRVVFTCMFVLFGLLQVFAHENEFPFSTTVKVYPTGAGKAYASYDGTAKTPTTTEQKYDATIPSWNDPTSATVTLSASANTGYRFLRWENENGTVISRTSTTTDSQPYNTTGANYSTNKYWWDFLSWFTWKEYSTERAFTYTAHFGLLGSIIAKVADGQESVGSADILEETFSPGEEITLVASNINGSDFEGWSFSHWELNGTTVSTDKVLKVTVPSSETTLTYIAYFEKANTEYYCLIRNKSTRKYLKLSDTRTCSTPTNNNNPVSSFNGSFTLIDNTDDKAISDPGCVFILKGTSKNNIVKKATLISQSISVGYVNGSKIINDNDYGLTIEPASAGTYLISSNYHATNGEHSADIPLYFRDNNGTPDMAGVRSATSEWEILELSHSTLSQNYIGAKPNTALSRDGKYYTSLYTTFPYELQSGKAYYVNSESIEPYGDEGKYKVVCQEVADGKVPANSPVILELDATNVASNKILPLPLNTEINPLSGNYLQGHITVVNGNKSGDGKIYVLSTGGIGLGFYKLKTGTTIPDNKAYANLPEEAQSALQNMIFSFGENDEQTNTHQITLPIEISNDIYDLQGRKVDQPSNGIYILNGKKHVVK